MSDEGDIGERTIHAVVWGVGVAMIGVGLLGMAGGSGILWLVAGVLVTPRTREEVVELCSIWIESRDSAS